MNANQLLSDEIIPLKTSDTGEEALGAMSDFGVKHFPIVNNEQFLGLISEEDILDYDVEDAIGSYSLSLLRPFVRLTDHIFDIMRVLAENQLTLIPVVDLENNYVGVITQESIIRYFSGTITFQEPGSVIILEVSKRNYSLSEIARLSESENIIILGIFLMESDETDQIEIVLKVNSHQIQAFLALLERFKYLVKAAFTVSSQEEAYRERYESLLHYLNV